jgi:hypothetical protein
VSTAGTRNVTEWAKKKECWEAVQTVGWTAPETLLSLPLRQTGSKGTAEIPDDVGPKSIEEGEAMEVVCAVRAEAWKSLSTWAKQTDNLAAWQRGIAFSIGRALESDRKPSVKQAVQGQKILAEATRLGFDLQVATS